MIENLTLTCFRAHEALTLNFGPGLQVLQGANEAGKSTVHEALAYALFGSSALRTSLDEAATWGHPPSHLKVELSLRAEGKLYRYKRAKSGAEVTLDGAIYATGQKEVSALSAKLLGADAALASKLLLAPQGAIRGALEEGAKALSVLIEDLAGFSAFDRVLEAAQARLALGSPALLEERLKGAESALAVAKQHLPEQPDAETHAQSLQRLRDAIRERQARLEGLSAAASDADGLHKEVSARYLQGDALVRRCERLRESRDLAHAQARRLGQPERADAEGLAHSKARLSEAEGFARRFDLYALYRELPEGPRHLGDSAEFKARSDALASQKTGLEKALHEIALGEASALAQRLDGGNCSKCGQATGHLAHVLSTNAEIDRSLEALALEKASAQARLERVRSAAAASGAVKEFALEFLPLLGRLDGAVSLDTGVYPPEAFWTGALPESPPDLDALRGEASRAERAVKSVEAANAQRRLAAENEKSAEDLLALAEAEASACAWPTASEVLALKTELDQATGSHLSEKGKIILAGQEVSRLADQFEAASALWNMAQSRAEDAARNIEACQSDLAQLAANNALVKKVRALRPVVANKVWGAVLGAVSAMFSQIRGEASQVTREGSGFKVNGQSIESLSGSTLDALGLALRVALTKTFLPACDLLLLDEACAAFDAPRTEALLGFVAQAGFGQVLFITHEDVSEGLASGIHEI